MKIKCGIGQDSHAFDRSDKKKKLVLAGVVFPGEPPLKGNSDADVVLHAVTNAVSGITGMNILGKVADRMCREQGITDSRYYLLEAMKYLNGYHISHISISLECQTPKISPLIDRMKSSIADILGIPVSDIGLTATSGEGLTAFGRGEGIHVFSIITAFREDA